MNDSSSARMFAYGAHMAMKQHRKYTDEYYGIHLDEVAGLVGRYVVSDLVVSAAYLHDVLEDTGVTIEDLQYMFGDYVSTIVSELTDVYTKKQYPHLNRKQRKELEAERLSCCGWETQTIKLADLLSNSYSILKHDPKFAKVYIPEKLNLLNKLTRANSSMRLYVEQEFSKLLEAHNFQPK